MTKRRFHAPGYSVSTKGHSVLHRGTYGFTPRRFVGDTISPEFIPRRIYDTSHEEYALGSAVSQATSFSDASLYETYDSASRSRGRDQKLLSDATAAIVSSEPHSSPRASAAVRRVARKSTATPPPVKLYPSTQPLRTEVARYPSQAPIYYTPPPRPRTVIVIGANTPWQGYYYVPYGPRVRAPGYMSQSAPRPESVPWEPRLAPRYFEQCVPRPAIVPWEPPRHYRFVYRGRGVISSPAKYYSRPKRAKAPPRYRLRYLQPDYYYRKPRRAKAAIVASKVELEPRRKRPRSKFAAEKLRATRVPGEESIYDGHTSGLQASRPPLRSRAGYRLEARTDPSDVMYKPGSFGRMRAQVRDAHDKLDRHRQMLDRYLVDSGPAYDVQGSVQRKMEELERRDPTYRSSRKTY